MTSQKRLFRGKEADPAVTSERLRQILAQNGFECEYHAYPSQLGKCCCSRVTVDGFGANGKGLSPEFCMASAYAELMERMQNRMFAVIAKHDPSLLHKETTLFPACSAQESVHPCIEAIREQLMQSLTQKGCESAQAAQAVESLLTEHSADGQYALFPFYSVREGREVLLPTALLTTFTGSNGMAAGNTLEEAIVQGLSEILERYVTQEILYGGLTPPQIQRNYLAQHHSEINAIIEEIEKDGRYSAMALDASLGMDIPCTACVILNKETLTFGVSFAAHPDRQIALERCFSEAMQGWTLDSFSRSSSVSFAPPRSMPHFNIRNIFKTSSGQYPHTLLGRQSSWAFTPWPHALQDNHAMLQELCQLFEKLDCDLFIRDVSYMGFPSVYIYAPGLSEILPVSASQLMENTALVRAQDLFRRLDRLTTDEVEQLRSIAASRQNHALGNTLSSLTATMFTKGVPETEDETGFLAAVCCWRLGRDRDALVHLAGMSGNTYLHAVRHYIMARQYGLTAQQAGDILSTLTDPATAERVKWQFEDRQLVLERVYPHCCGDCERCEAPCSQRQVQRDYLKLLEMEKASDLHTEEIQKLFRFATAEDK